MLAIVYYNSEIFNRQSGLLNYNRQGRIIEMSLKHLKMWSLGLTIK